MGKGWTAKNACKYTLYELAVQCVEADIDFVDRVYRERRGKLPLSMREDFCGSAAAAVEFVRRRPENTAIGLDLDADVLAWGDKHHRQPLGKDASRVKLMQKNVMDVTRPGVDIELGMNFSYFIFKKREELKKYFKTAYSSLKSDGMLFLDAYGGSDAQVPQEEKHKKKGFTYIWDQHSFNPINNDVENRIHFKFRDGTQLRDAFIYEWRLWSVKEITELLEEVGFKRVDVYWEGWDDEEEEGDGNFQIATTAESCLGWVAYLVAEK